MEIASNRTALHDAILDYVAGAEASGTVIDVSAEAVRLMIEYPQSGMTIDEVCLALERAAVAAGAVIMAPGQVRNC